VLSSFVILARNNGSRKVLSWSTEVEVEDGGGRTRLTPENVSDVSDAVAASRPARNDDVICVPEPLTSI
jgi:hypothetical protein